MTHRCCKSLPPVVEFDAAGRFDKGRFRLDEGVFRSNAVGLGATG